MERKAIGVRVSITDQIRKTSSRREVQFPKGLPADILRIRLGSESKMDPAIIGIRAMLEILQTSQDRVHQWKLTVYPHTEAMLRRFLAETGTMINEGSLLFGDNASNNMVRAFEDALRQVSDLSDPEPLNGTTIHLWFGLTIDGREHFESQASSLVGIPRERNRIEIENDMRRKEASIYFPFTRWKIWQKPFDEVLLPDVPASDEWRRVHSQALGQLFSRSFKPCLRSLWKAVYGSGMEADQLRSLGFPIDQIGQTVVSGEDLRKLIQAQDQASRRTFVFIPEEKK